ncbi:alpha-2-macroglobulin-like [Dipodomys merriami]|uniref:alpha-2-macroglobulin-like n=1 Tax=Dipodomys merriami TaxID=94247 RepID=UPI0038558FE5
MGSSKLLPSSLIFFLLFLVPTRASTPAQPQYMVLVPSLLHAGTEERGCVLVRNLNETVTVTAALESIRENRSLFRNLTVEKDLFHCVQFTIPPILTSEVMFLTIQVKGETQEFKKRSTVMIKNKQSLVFVQTDKPIYKPGQTVQFRVVSLDENFRPQDEVIRLLYIQDPKGNRLAQWQNLQLDTGLQQLSFPLASEPPLGSYSITVQMESGVTVRHQFTVEEFVLPKFEVQVTMPRVITIMEQELNVSVCGLYTFGKPVPGLGTLHVCREYIEPSSCHGRESEAFCETFSHQLNSNGCFTQLVKTKGFQLKRQEYEMRLQAEAKIQEEGTGVELKGKASSSITRTITKVSFVRADSHFRPGIPFFAQVRLTDGKGVPMPNKIVFITANEAKHQSNATTDEQGLVQFSINTTGMTGKSLTVSVKHQDHRPCYGSYRWLSEEHVDAQHTARPVFSRSESYVRLEPAPGRLPCHQEHLAQAHYVLSRELLPQLSELVFYYLVMAKGSILWTGLQTRAVAGEEDLRGQISISLPAGPQLAPATRLLLFSVLPDGETVGDAAKYEIESCLPNLAELSFEPAQSPPGARTRLRVSSARQALCALRAVDQSVLLLKPEAELSARTVYNLLPVKDLTGFPEGLAPHGEDTGECVDHQNVYIHGILYSPVSNSDEKDMYMFLKDMGLKVFTNSKIHKPKVCAQPPQYEVQYSRYAEPAALMYRGSGHERSLQVGSMQVDRASGPAAPPTPVRKYFPDTWIWELQRMDASGVADVEVTVPDTITEWKASALCLSPDAGLGLSPPASLRAFQPFFLELTLPYAAMRGETCALKATVFNYLPHCIRVQVELEPSPSFTSTPLDAKQDSHCVCGHGRVTLSWAVIPKKLGTMNITVSAEAVESPQPCDNEVAIVPEQGSKDIVIRSLLVEPEGLEREIMTNSLLCPSDAELSEQISLTLPENVVEDSARASVFVLGDILSSAMQNTQNLLQMPFGCGEQNMALFAPNIYVLDYLNETQQLTKELQTKALGYLSAGYQRQLNYRHQDGSFSTFGERHGRPPGNTWLTAFVLKTFAQARRYIFIDELHITRALQWMSRGQKDNGCFTRSGSLLNNAMKGGVDDEVTLSAYIAIALLEIPLPVTHPVVRNALFCLEMAWGTAKEGAHGSHVYTKALLAYAFALAGNEEKKKELLASLEAEAVKEGDSMHWTRPQKPSAPVGRWYQMQAPSVEVEMTSYVLLALLTARPAPGPDALTTATKVVRWLTKQQNAQGGFSSTQDTVVALQALSRYGAATFSRTGKAVQVSVQGLDFSEQFQVNDQNRLVLQQAALPRVPGQYKLSVSGQGCVFIQTSLRYNILPGKEDLPFTLEVHTDPPTCDGPKAHTSFRLVLNVSYVGTRPASNMAIVDVKMLSGFSPMKATVKMLERSNAVSRTEVSSNHVLIYLDKVTRETVKLAFEVAQDVPVSNLKAAVVKVYDYYETDEFAVAEYNAPCSNVHENS